MSWQKTLDEYLTGGLSAGCEEPKEPEPERCFWCGEVIEGFYHDVDGTLVCDRCFDDFIEGQGWGKRLWSD